MSADASIRLPPPKILLVDDSLTKRIRSRLLLARLECQVIEAEDGESALRAFERHDFALVVLDVQMPGMDGFEVAQRIAALPQGRALPIIFCTATLHDDGSRLRGYGTGAVDYILEPADDTVLLSKVRVFLELYQARAELNRALLEREKFAELARYEANHDGLTGLPNRRLFLDRLEQVLRRAERRKSGFAVLYVDIDDFKPVNDHHGHLAGDALLVAIGARMVETLRRHDTVARFGGDEFAVILDEPIGAVDALHKVKLFAERLRFPYRLSGGDAFEATTVTVGASVGVSLYPEDGGNARMLLSAADAALYAAKRAGKNRCFRAEAF